MSGYNVDGTPLCVHPIISQFISLSSLHNSAVTAVTAPSDLPRPKPPKQPDARRNLYVLGLPFDLTKYGHLTNYISRPLLTTFLQGRVYSHLLPLRHRIPCRHSRHRGQCF